MSKKLKVRTLKMNKLPYGKYQWVAFFAQELNNARLLYPNGLKISPIRNILENSAIGKWRFDYVENVKKNRIYTKVYLTEKMDLALLKMCYAPLLRKIYKIELKTATPPLE